MGASATATASGSELGSACVSASAWAQGKGRTCTASPQRRVRYAGRPPPPRPTTRARPPPPPAAVSRSRPPAFHRPQAPSCLQIADNFHRDDLIRIQSHHSIPTTLKLSLAAYIVVRLSWTILKAGPFARFWFGNWLHYLSHHMQHVARMPPCATLQ